MAEMGYFKKIGIAIDQTINSICGGWPDETLSSRSWRAYKDGRNKWPKRVIDAIWFWEKDHCRLSYESERTDRHLPPEMRG